MNKSKFRVMFLLMVMFVFVAACSLPGTSSSSDVVATEEAATEVASITESAPPTDPAIQHTTIPIGLPEKQSGEAGDFNSVNVIANKSVIGGDRFTFGRFERPFNANTMDVYFPELDIVYTQAYQDDTWIYGRIFFNDISANNPSAQYAVEIDTDLNGKSEWLIIANKPSSTEWTVENVRVYQDANNDVGGEMPMLTDKSPVSGDGFETLVFDQGKGNNSDTAWVRISPEDSKLIEFAINRAALNNPTKYLINFWAGNNLDPAKFDINDLYTHEQAGAADNGLEYFYPIKEVAEIDNSCRMAIGFQATGNEPGICDTYKPQVQGSSPSASGCTAKPIQVLACSISADPSYSCSWNSASCSCDCAYVGPK